MCSKANGWNESAQIRRIPTLLACKSFSVYERLKLTEDQRNSFGEVKKEFLKIMEPDTEERRRFDSRALEHRHFLHGEDLDTFVYQLDLLMDRACIRLSPDIRRPDLLDSLIDGLASSICERLALIPSANFQMTLTKTQEFFLMDSYTSSGSNAACVAFVDHKAPQPENISVKVTMCEVEAAQPDLVKETRKLSIRLEELEGSVKEGTRGTRRLAGPC